MGKRKTRDIYEVRGDYGHGHGYEAVTREETRTEARARLREYRENEPGVPFRIVLVREKIATTPTDLVWGVLVDRWHDQGRLAHLLRGDGSPACGVRYFTSNVYDDPSMARCKRCAKIEAVTRD